MELEIKTLKNNSTNMIVRSGSRQNNAVKSASEYSHIIKWKTVPDPIFKMKEFKQKKIASRFCSVLSVVDELH